MKIQRFMLISIVLSVSACAFVGGCGTGRPDWEGNLDERSGPEMTAEGVRFTLFAPKSSRVNLVGDFNNWSTMADPLYDRQGTGLWTVTIPLAPGRYEYKFYVDNEKWIPDPGNPDRTDDGFGGWNSVLTVAQP